MHPILIFLPAIAYVLLTLIYARKASVSEVSEALVKAHIVIFTFIAISTELLSLINWISFPSVLTVWLLFLLPCSGTVFIYWRKHCFSSPEMQRITPLTRILVGIITLILTSTLSTGILYPPNNWDSMTYHMSRIAHWVANNTVAFYPTAITRQNYMAPLAEFGVMHFQILTGCDFYANLIQWFSFLVLICLGQLVAGELGLSKKQQLISATVIATLPMAILQASSTQNDLVVSSFLMSFGFFMLRLRENFGVENLLLAALSLGLALLTKGTAFLYGAAIGITLAVPVFMRHKCSRRSFVKATAALSSIIIIALLLNTGHFWRNYHLYGNPLSTEGEHFRNEEISVATLMSNLLRNGSLHFGTPLGQINSYHYRAIQWLLGSQVNNPKTTLGGLHFDIYYRRHEDYAGNPIHMLVALFSIVLLPVMWGQGYCTKAIGYAIGVMLGIVLYCLFLKWQPWASRLHTPLFAMASPLLAMTITTEVGGIGKRITIVVVFSMLFYSLFFAFDNKSRSLVSLDWCHKDRMELYFINKKDLLQGYENAINFLQEVGPQEVGLYLGDDDWEYPFWVLASANRKDGRSMTFRHVGVNNISETVGEDESLPLYVIATKKIDDWKHALAYSSVYASDQVSVFRKLENSPATNRWRIPLHFPAVIAAFR